MKCSDCSKPVLPVVAIDIDGTLGDYHGHLRDFAQAYLDKKLPDRYNGLMELSDYWGLDKRSYRDMKLAYRQGGMKRNMPAFDGATEFMKVLRQHAEVWITTTRPHARLDNIDPDTMEWLRRHDIPFDGLLYDADKYNQLTRRVEAERIVAVLDDLPDQWEAAYQLFGPSVPILRKNPYNGAIVREQQALDLTEAYRMIKERIDAWRLRHGA